MDTKWIIGIIVVIVIIIGAALALGGGGQQSGGTIQIAGSTSVQPVAEKLAEVYTKSNTNVKINVQGGGSSVGVKSAADGTADIGTSSRELKDDEKNQDLKTFQIGKDGVVIAINKDNTVEDLTSDQIKDIFSGKITNWKDVGGPDATINVIVREEGSGTRDAFEELVMGKETKVKSDAIVQSSTEAVKQTVAQDPNAIGYISLAHMSDDVKALKVDGVAPSQETVKDGSYKISRPFLFVTKGEPTGIVKAFIDWVLGPEGQKVVADEGIVPNT